MKKVSILMAVVMLFAASGCAKEEQHEEIAVPIYKADKINYNTEEAVIGDITKKYYVDQALFGYADHQNVMFKTDGIVDEIKVSSGDMVKKGDVLCTLKTDDLDRQIQEKQLYVDQAQKTYDTLWREGVSGAELELAQTDLELQQMQLERLENSYDDYTVYAPCDGQFFGDGDTSFSADITEQLGRSNVIVRGANVRRSQMLGIVGDSSNQAIICIVYDNDLKDVNFGTRVRLEQGSYEGWGKVIDVRTGDNSGMNVYNYIVQPDEPDELDKDMFVSCCFDVYSKLDVVIVPSKAVKTTKQRSYVNLLIDGAKIEQDVEVGIVDGDKTEILSGLSGGEQVILNS